MRALHAARLGAPLYYGSLRALGVTAVSRRLRNAGLILCYHNVVPPGEQAGAPGLHLPRDRFERQMRWLALQYEIVPLRELVERLTVGTPLRSVAAVTFDDGYDGVFEHALPVLEALRIPATVFVVAEALGASSGFWWDRPEIVDSATPGRRETWLTDLRGDGAAIVSECGASADRPVPRVLRAADSATLHAWIGRRVEIGVHSATHRSLPTLTDAELEHEIVAGRALVHRATGIWPECFAYPYGRWDARVRALVRRAGYRSALTLDAGLVDATADPWSLRRVNVPAAISDAAFEAWTAGLQGRRA